MLPRINQEIEVSESLQYVKQQNFCHVFHFYILPCRLAVANRTVFIFFHMLNKQMGSTYAFPQLESHDPEVLLYTRIASESPFAFLTLEDQEALLPFRLQKGKIHFHLKTKTPAL